MNQVRQLPVNQLKNGSHDLVATSISPDSTRFMPFLYFSLLIRLTAMVLSTAKIPQGYTYTMGINTTHKRSAHPSLTDLLGGGYIVLVACLASHGSGCLDTLLFVSTYSLL